MNVLILGIHNESNEGGGYTLTQDIFESLISKVKGETIHRFFVTESSAPTGRKPGDAPDLSIVRVRRRLLRRVLEKLAYEIKRRLAPGQKLRTPFEKAFQNELLNLGVDCVLSLSPWDTWPGVPNIVTVWDLEHRRKPYFPEVVKNGKWESREEIHRSVLPKAAIVITGTALCKAQIECFYGVDPGAIRVIPFPTPSYALEHAMRSATDDGELPSGISGEFLFYPAQYWAHKNHIRLLEAVKILRENDGWRGTLVCCGADKGNLSYLQQCAKDWKIETSVKFLGFVEQNQLVALYRKALALSFVSYFGPDNLPPLEAFALGCPVIASELEGARETLGESALYVNPDDPLQIVDAVRRLTRERGLRENLIELGRERALKWTVSMYVDQLTEVLDWLEPRFQCFR